jgi:hypothetical protein
LRNKHHRTR